MNYLNRLIVLAACILLSALAQADDQDQKYEKCESAQRSSNSALAADDWAAVQKYEKKAILYCTDAGDPSFEIVLDYGTLSEAQFNLKRFQDALNTANTCIDTYYNAPTCHFYKVLTLKRLGKSAEAVRAKEIALKVFNTIMAEDENNTNETKHYVNVLKIEKQYSEMYSEKLASG